MSRYFGQGAAAGAAAGVVEGVTLWAPNWNIPSAGSDSTVGPDAVPYYLAPAGSVPVTAGDNVTVDGSSIPYYLARPDPTPFSIPTWVWPVAGGALAVGALVYIVARKKRRR